MLEMQLMRVFYTNKMNFEDEKNYLNNTWILMCSNFEYVVSNSNLPIIKTILGLFLVLKFKFILLIDFDIRR